VLIVLITECVTIPLFLFLALQTRLTTLVTGLFADMPTCGLWYGIVEFHGKTFHGQAGLFADKLFEVTTLPNASLQQAGARCPVTVPATCARHLMLLVIIDHETAEELKFVN